MGFYLEVPSNHDKADLIIEGSLLNVDGTDYLNGYTAEIIPKPDSFSEVPEDKALICVVDNGIFEGAGYCFSPMEFDAFSYPADTRPKTWLLIDKWAAQKATGFYG